jgi:hypothetical protein
MAAKARIPKNLTVAELNKLKPGQLSTAQKSRVARLLSNPGTRHLLADRFLAPAQQQARKTNVFNAAPVVPGSSVTNKDLTGQRDAAAALKYGGAEAQAQRDIASRQAAVGQTGGFFDQYLADLRAHEANTAAINAQTQGAVQGLAGSIQGLGAQTGQNIAQGNQSLQAATGVAPASVTQDASNATMLRQALTASFGAMLAGQGANAQGYADTLAHVVGPGQKLQGVVRAQGDVTKAMQARSDLAKEKGSFEQQFEDEFKNNEAKNVLAGQIAGVKTQQEQEKIDIAKGLAGVTAIDKATRAQETARHNRAAEANTHRATTVSARNAATRRDAQNREIYTSGPFAGKSKNDIQGMSPKARQQLVDKYNRTKGKAADPATQAAKDFQAKYGVKPVGTVQINNATDSISQAASWIRKVQQSNPGMSLGQIGQLLSSGQAKSKDSVAIPKQNTLFVRVAMDLAQYGGITPATADRLHHAGYSVSALRLKNAPKPSTTAGQLVPGVGSTVARP